MSSTAPQGMSSPFAPPQAEVDDAPRPEGELELAGRGMRLLAAIVDGLIVAALLWLLSRVSPWNFFATGPEALALGHRAVGALVGTLVFLAINGVLLFRSGQTVGKRITGMRIALPDGTLPSSGRLLLRYGIGWLVTPFMWLQMIYGLVDSLMIFGSARRCLHDHIAGTIVVKT
jgi:uncharacterized RDD family membrane protein YckC